jgi:O-antigen/teichoic acid export membrane protein
MENFFGMLVAGILFLVTLATALVAYRRKEKRRKESSFFSTEFRGTFLGAECVFGVAVIAVGLMADLYVTSQLVGMVLLIAGTIGQYSAHKRIIRWAHREAGKDRMVKGTRPRRHMRARA